MNQPINVLFIEDNPGDARLIKEELRAVTSKTRFHLEWMDRLEKGLDYLAAKHPVQAVLLDLSLPDSQGLDTLRCVLDCAPEIPVIVMTGLADENVGMEALQAGAQDYLIKGEVDGRLLVRVIQYAIQRQEIAIQLADALAFTERIVTSSPIGIFTYKVSGECLSANAAASQMVGAAVEQLHQQNFHQIESWKRSGLYTMAIQAINSGKNVTGDVHLVTTFGRDAWYAAQCVPLHSGGEELLLLMLSDITERKESERALREREALLDKTQSIAHVGSWELDLLTNKLRWSDEVHRLLGVGVMEFKGTYEALLNVVHPEDRQKVQDTHSESLRKGLYSYELEHRIIHQFSGEVRFVHQKCEHVRDDSGEIVRSVGMIQDITERKQAETALRDSERFVHETLNALTSNIAILDELGTIVAVNRSWREFARANGADPAAVSEGANYLAVCYEAAGNHAEEAAPVAAGIRDVMQGKQESFSLEYPCHSPEEKRWFVLRVTRFQGADPVRVVVAHEYITERKLAEAALESSEKRFRTWVENSSDIVTVLSAEGTIVYESPSIQRLLGYQPEELLGKSALEFIHAEDQTKILAAFERNLQNPEAIASAEFRFRHRDGSWRVLEGVGHAYVDEHGRFAGLIHSRDITERKDAEAAVAAMQKRFQSLIENAPDGIALLGIDGKLSQVTPSTQQILGYTLKEAQGQDPALLTHPDDLPALLGQLQELIQDPEKIVHTQYRFQHRDGSWRWLESTVSNLMGEPSIQAIVFNYRDITERKQAEERIMLQANLLSAVGSAVIATDLQGRVVYWNPAAERLYGWSSEEALGRPTIELTVAGPSEEQAQEILRDLVAGKSWSGEFLVQRKDGSVFPAFVSDSPLLGTDGNLIGMIGVSNDITALKQVESALKTSEQRYRDLTENFPNGVVTVYNRDLTLVFVAGLELKASGYRAEDLVEKHFSELAPTETWELARPKLMAAFEGNVSSYEAAGLNGQYYSVNVAPLRDAHGDVHEILVVSQNITDLKKTQLALREKEQLLTEAQRIGHIGSWSYDVRRDSMTFSDEMYRLLDILPEDFQHNSREFLALVYPSDRPAVAQWMENIKEGIQARELNFRLFHKNGELRYLYWTGAVEFDATGRPGRFIGTAQDVTERRAAEIQIDQHIKRLTALSEIDRAIASSLDQRYTLGIILSQIIAQLQVDAAAVLLLDPETEHLNYVTGQGFRTKKIEAAHLPMGAVYAGQVAKERRMIRLLDLREATTNPAFSAFVHEEGFVSYIGVPLVVKGRVRGVLEVFQRTVLQPYKEWLDFFHTLVGQTAVAIENTSLFENLQDSNRELIRAYDATIEGWSRAMDLRDRETEGHTQRVTKLTVELAQSMGIEESRLVHVRRGALLHDIGKLGVPDHVLFKPGPLTVEEREIIEQHVEFAYALLAPISYLKPALNIPYFHHEKWDGSGYPLGLKGEQIPLEARIFALAEVWDALLSDRPYRKAWTREQTLEHIRAQSGTHFDPRVVECFLALLPHQA